LEFGEVRPPGLVAIGILAKAFRIELELLGEER